MSGKEEKLKKLTASKLPNSKGSFSSSRPRHQQITNFSTTLVLGFWPLQQPAAPVNAAPSNPREQQEFETFSNLITFENGGRKCFLFMYQIL